MDWKRDQAIELRKSGMTYQAIADSMGISKAYVGQLLACTTDRRNYHIWNPDTFAYPAIANWANENQLTKQDIAEMIGYSCNSGSAYRIMRALEHETITKRQIDALMDVTGMSYEELFSKKGAS